MREIADRLGHVRYPCGSSSRCAARRLGERHDRQRRVDRERSRHERAVTDVEPLHVPRLAVCVDDRPLRVAAHPAGALHVRRGQPGPEHLRRARRGQHVAREVERRGHALALGRRERRIERLVRRSRRGERLPLFSSFTIASTPDPAAEAPHRLDERLSPERPVLVLDRRRERDRDPGSSSPRSRSRRPRRAGAPSRAR